MTVRLAACGLVAIAVSCHDAPPVAPRGPVHLGRGLMEITMSGLGGPGPVTTSVRSLGGGASVARPAAGRAIRLGTRGPLGPLARTLSVLPDSTSTVDGTVQLQALSTSSFTTGTRTTDLRAVLASLTPAAPPAPGSPRARARIVRAVRWAHRLWPRRGGAADWRSRALLTWAALRRWGWPVALVTGVARSGSEGGAHAWVEDAPGQVIPEWAEPVNTIRFAANFRWPPAAPTPPGRAADRSPAPAAAAPAV